MGNTKSNQNVVTITADKKSSKKSSSSSTKKQKVADVIVVPSNTKSNSNKTTTPANVMMPPATSNITKTKNKNKAKQERPKPFTDSKLIREDVYNVINSNVEITNKQFEKLVDRALMNKMSNAMQTRRKNIAMSLLDEIRGVVIAEQKVIKRREASREYNIRNRTRILAQKKIYREANKDKIREYAKMWRERKLNMSNSNNTNTNTKSNVDTTQDNNIVNTNITKSNKSNDNKSSNNNKKNNSNKKQKTVNKNK